MNKYLLLRDNKQSGPYTVQELISNGMKAYDLVWLEGKSAAWRYPSEIEELKAHAPVVEEQPFDRFYRKPEAIQQNITLPEVDHSRYEPKPAEKKEIATEPSGKVYINFPAAKKSAEPAPVVVLEKKIDEPVFSDSFSHPVKEPVQQIIASANRYSKRNNSQFKYLAVAACLLMVSLITYLVIDYNSQRQNIEELNALVQKLADKEKTQKTVVIPAAVVHEELPPAPEQQADLNYSHETTDEKPVTPAVKPVNSSVEKPRSGVSEKESIVFKEAKTNPAAETAAPTAKTEQGSESDKSVPHENLFKLVSVKSNDYKTGVLGGISNLQLELTNSSLSPLHKVAVEIKYLGPEKKVVRTQTVYFENVAPGEQTTLDVPKSNRGVSIDYTIIDIKS